jgi:hypothetical protein
VRGLAHVLLAGAVGIGFIRISRDIAIFAFVCTISFVALPGSDVVFFQPGGLNN